MDARTLFKLWRRFILFPFIIVTLQGLYLVRKAYDFIMCINEKKKIPEVVRTPDDRFKDLHEAGYTFQANYVELPIGGGKNLPRMHYLDEGRKDAAEVILCLHGEPSWSFLYRHMIPILVTAGYRVIAPDFIGFGKSDKFVDPDSYSHEMHTMSLRLLLDHIKVKNITLVCQDWGGLTGLSVVKDCPQYFSKLVIMNTGLPTGMPFNVQTVYKATPFILWRSAVQFFGTYLPITWVFRLALKKKEPVVLEGYGAPFPSSLFKGGAAKWPLLVPISPCCHVAKDMQATKDFLADKWRNPALIMFSDHDPITKPQEKVFAQLLPHAANKTVRGAGHFIQEDKGEEVAEHIVSFINGKL